jgi:hypothetical protein
VTFAFLLAVLAFRNVTVVDVNGARPGYTVVVNDGRISALGSGVKVPAGAKVIEGKGKFLIPALWDMHVHLWEKDPMGGLYLAAGVTGIRDMGSDLARTRALRTEIDAGRAAGPTIFTPGPPVDGPDSRLTMSPVIKVTTPEDARRAVDTVEKNMGDFVKILSTMSEDAYFSLAQRARVVRMPFAGHLPEEVSASDAINARQKSIDHLFGMALSCSYDETRLRRERKEAIEKKDYAMLREIRTRTYATYSTSLANEMFRRMARMGVWQVPTLTLRRRMALLDLDRLAEAPEMKYIPEAIRKSWTDPREDLKKASNEQIQNFREDYDFHAKLVSAMQRTGVGILAGTDTGDPYVVPGFSLHDELEFLVESGLTPDQAIASATIQPARYFALEDSYGTVDQGKIASLVLLDADPLADIKNTRRIAAVVHRGKLLERNCLDTLLKGRPAPCAFAPAIVKPPPPAKRAPAPRKRPARRR